MINKIKKLFIFIFLSIPIISFAEVENASSSEFPVTPGSIINDHEGFVLEWEDGNMSDFLGQVKNMFDIEFDSVDVFGFGSSDSSNIKEHDYHRHDHNDYIASANNSSEVKSQEANQQDQNKTEEEPDWRTERKWWQRGAPVL